MIINWIKIKDIFSVFLFHDFLYLLKMNIYRFFSYQEFLGFIFIILFWIYYSFCLVKIMNFLRFIIYTLGVLICLSIQDDTHSERVFDKVKKHI